MILPAELIVFLSVLPLHFMVPIIALVILKLCYPFLCLSPWLCCEFEWQGWTLFISSSLKPITGTGTY